MVNAGFTPEFQRVLNSMGIDFNKMRVSMNAGLSTPWKESKIDLNSPYFKFKELGINPESLPLSPTNAAATKDALNKQGKIDPKVQSLYDQVLKMRDVEAQRGGPDTKPHTAWWKKALDIISRPGRGVTTGISEDLSKNKDHGGFFRYKDFVHGFKQGFTGKESKTGADILKQYGVHNKAALFAGGLGIDIAADPLSYVGAGVGKKAITSIPKLTKTQQVATDTAAKIAAGPKLAGYTAPTAEDLTKTLGVDLTAKPTILTPTAKVASIKAGQTGIDNVTNLIGGQAAKTAQLNLADDLTKLGFDSKEAVTTSKRWLNPALASNPQVLGQRMVWTELLKKLPETKAATYLDKTGPQIFKDAKLTATKQLTEILNANMEQQIKRSLQIRGLGGTLTIAPIPDTAVKSLSALAKAPVLNSAIKTYNKTFKTGSDFDHQLYVTKSRAAGKAEQRINIGQQNLVKAFSGIGKNRRLGWMSSLVSNPNNYGRGVFKLADGSDMGDFAYKLFQHFGQYIDWSTKGAGIISLRKLNAYLPHTMKFDESILRKHPEAFNPSPTKGAQNFLNLIHLHKDIFKNIDPQDLFYHMHIGVEKALARDQFMRAISDMGIELKPKDLVRNPLTGQLVKQGSGVAHELVSKHGYEPIITKTTREHINEVDPSFTRYLKDRVYHPDIKKGLVHMINMIDDDKAVDGLSRFYDKALGYFKKAVTLPNPGYHIRNSVGDLMTSYVDGVGGLRGLASYAQAAKVIKAINPLSKHEELNNILTAPVTAAGEIQDPLKQISKLLTGGNVESVSGRTVMKKNPRWKDLPGKYISAEQIMAAYQHTGLKRGFVASDITRELRSNPNALMKGVHAPMDAIQKFSQDREDYFRLAHFIDRIKRSNAPTFEQAANEAAYYVKKHHFDYTDVTRTERAVFARVLPFYKFQRFATPLMLQAFFATPGKILNAQKVLNNMAYAQGYSNDGGFLPTADQILPEYMRDTMLVPLFEHNGNTVFGGNNLLPSTSIFSQTLGLESSNPREIAGSIGQNLIQNVNPFAQIPAELYFGKRVLGKGQIPVQDSSGSYLPYISSKLPVSNLGINKPNKADFSTSLINFLSGLGLSENTPQRQQSELYREKDQITTNRKHQGYKTPKKTGQSPPNSRPPNSKPKP